MRLLLVLVVVLASGCPKRMVRHVYVPKSSAACWRECQLISETCRQRFKVAYCEDRRLDCLLTCDGAYETDPVEEP